MIIFNIHAILNSLLSSIIASVLIGPLYYFGFITESTAITFGLVVATIASTACWKSLPGMFFIVLPVPLVFLIGLLARFGFFDFLSANDIGLDTIISSGLVAAFGLFFCAGSLIYRKKYREDC